MKNFILLELFSFFCCIPNIFSADLMTLQQGTSIGDVAVMSGNGTVKYQYVRIDSLSQYAQEEDIAFLNGLTEGSVGVIQNVVDIDFTFVFDGTKIACHEYSYLKTPKGTQYKRNWLWTYNGETTALLRLDPIGQNGLILPIGSIYSDNQFHRDMNDPRYDSMMIRGTSVGEFLSGKYNEQAVENIHVTTTEIIDGIECDVVQGTIRETDETITVWLVSNMMYRPKRIELVSPQGRIAIQNIFKEYGSGVWFPKQIIRETYYTSENSKQEVLYKRETISVQDDYAVNAVIPVETFEISFPIGMTVYDFRTGTSFEVK